MNIPQSMKRVQPKWRLETRLTVQIVMEQSENHAAALTGFVIVVLAIGLKKS